VCAIVITYIKKWAFRLFANTEKKMTEFTGSSIWLVCTIWFHPVLAANPTWSAQFGSIPSWQPIPHISTLLCRAFYLQHKWKHQQQEGDYICYTFRQKVMAMLHWSKKLKKGSDGDTMKWCQKRAVQQKTKEEEGIHLDTLIACLNITTQQTGNYWSPQNIEVVWFLLFLI